MGQLMSSRSRVAACLLALTVSIPAPDLRAQAPTRPEWPYSEEQLRPFWLGEAMEGESVLFIRDEKTGEARASGEVRYEEGRDYAWKEGSREIVVPPGSRIATPTPGSLRRPAKSQRFQLTHRDGNGEIYFGGKLEYHELQTIVSYSHAPGLWTALAPKFDPKALPLTINRLQRREPPNILVPGATIPPGCNAPRRPGRHPSP